MSIDPLPMASVLHGIHVLKRDLHVEPLHADDEVCAKFCCKCHARCSRVGKHVAHSCAEHKSSHSKRIDIQRAKNPMFKSDGFRRTSRNTASPRKSTENPQRSKLWCHPLTIKQLQWIRAKQLDVTEVVDIASDSKKLDVTEVVDIARLSQKLSMLLATKLDVPSGQVATPAGKMIGCCMEASAGGKVVWENMHEVAGVPSGQVATPVAQDKPQWATDSQETVVDDGDDGGEEGDDDGDACPSTQPDGAGPLPDEIGRPASPSWREADAKRHQRVPQPPREPVNVVGQRHACTGDGPGKGGVILFCKCCHQVIGSYGPSDQIVWSLGFKC